MRLTARGADWLGTQDAADLYLDLMSASADEYEWLSDGAFPEDFSIIQDSLPFSLYMLKEGRQQPRTISDYTKEFSRAFPAGAGSDEGSYRSILMEAAFLILFLYGFCSFFGLIQLESLSLNLQATDSILITTELFDRLFVWKTEG
jgi:hypothetical protein